MRKSIQRIKRSKLLFWKLKRKLIKRKFVNRDLLEKYRKKINNSTIESLLRKCWKDPNIQDLLRSLTRLKITVTICYRLFPTVPDCSRQFPTILDCSQQWLTALFLTIPYWPFLTVPGRSWPFLTVPFSSCQFVSLLGPFF